MLSLASNRVHGFLRSSGKSLHQRQRFFPHNSARNDRIVYVNGLLKCGYSSTALTAAKTLVIVESPAKAKTIQKFLDEMKVKKNNMEGVAGSNSDTDEYIIDSCMGHINDLATGSKEVPVEYQQRYVHPKLSVRIADLGVDVHNNFKPIYVPLPGKAEVIRRLSSTAKTVDRILLATDEDREGEAISWFLVQALKPKVPYQRAVFHEITKSAIEHSFQHPREIDMNLVRAQETRRILDKIAGFTLSPLLWRYIASGLSAGRVQSCGLNLIAEVKSLHTFYT
jgi:DNA topoisomerase-1